MVDDERNSEGFLSFLRDLKLLGLEVDTLRQSNLEYPIILIMNYSPYGKDNSVCFALPLPDYCVGERSFPGSRCWMSCIRVRPFEGNNGPQNNPGYGEFVHNGIQFYPFSVNLSNYRCNANSTISLVRDLYNHIDFSDTSG